MTEQSETETPAETTKRALIPEQLKRVLIIVTAVYFGSFLWYFADGAPQRLLIPFQWEHFFFARSVAQAFNDEWFFFGASVTELFTHWLMLIAVIAGGYLAFDWIKGAKK